MKIRTLLILVFFSVALLPLLVVMTLNLPRVLGHFHAAEKDRLLLVAQQDYQKINNNLIWFHQSLRALSYNQGVRDLVSDSAQDISRDVIGMRVSTMIGRWYKDSPEVMSIRLVDSLGVERLRLNRQGDRFESADYGAVGIMEEDKMLVQKAMRHHEHAVFNVGIISASRIKSGVDENLIIFQLAIPVYRDEQLLGVICLDLDLRYVVTQYQAYLLYILEGQSQIIPPVAGQEIPPDLVLSANKLSDHPDIILGNRTGPMVVLPIFMDGHRDETIHLAYLVASGEVSDWVGAWRKQLLGLVAGCLVILCGVAIKVASVIDRFFTESLESFHNLLHNEKKMNFSWSATRELQELGDGLNRMSEQYVENLQARQIIDAQNKKLEMQLMQAQKMEAIGLLAGGVAHDLNNILSGIVSYPELMLFNLPETSELRKPLHEIKQSGERAAAVVADLLTVARGIACKKEDLDINVLIREYFDSPEFNHLHCSYKGIGINLQLGHTPLYISCSAVHIKKIFMNLVTNAAEAMSGTGSITVSTRQIIVDADLALELNLAEGDYVAATVQDDGSGIDKQDIEHIFEPFYTKKKMGRSGTGLGLAVVWNSVRDNNGLVTVISDSGGTCFDLYFPLVGADKTDNTVQNSNDQDLNSLGEHILVVDDESQQRDIAEKILQEYGYQVDTAVSGEEALAFLQTHKVDLVVLDMIMEPGLNGRKTYEQIQVIHPGQKAIVVSGFSESVEVEKCYALGAGSFVKKPYTMKNLALSVRSELDRVLEIR